jgi:N-carbamoyl-L-amino-acid hydrolase
VGTLGAIEVIRALEDAARDTLSSIEVVCFHAEEPSRFGFSCFGSKAMAGTLCDPAILDRCDPDGRSLAEALVEMGRDPARLCEARQSPGDIAAYVELHVEQGKVLETQGVSIGVVTDIAASSRYRVTFHGEAVHAGGTPMGQRKDALAAAAEAILAVERVCERYGQQDIVGTVGIVRSRPAMMNVVPGFAEIYFEVRGRVHYPKSRPMAEIREALEGIGRRRGVGVVVEILMEDEARTMSPGILAVIQRCAEDRGVPCLLMPSRTGHDALQLAHVTEAGMIFLPSRGGIGHDPGEWTAPEDIGRGLALLADTVVTLARTFACTAGGERASGAGVADGTASVCASVSRPSEE